MRSRNNRRSLAGKLLAGCAIEIYPPFRVVGVIRWLFLVVAFGVVPLLYGMFVSASYQAAGAHGVVPPPSIVDWLMLATPLVIGGLCVYLARLGENFRVLATATYLILMGIALVSYEGVVACRYGACVPVALRQPN